MVAPPRVLVLVLGLDPRAVPGIDAEPVLAVLQAAHERFTGAGAQARLCLLPLDDSAESRTVDALRQHRWDCVVVGGGIRKPEPLLTFFETVVNLIRRHAPTAAIAFNQDGGDSLEAANRWIATPQPDGRPPASGVPGPPRDDARAAVLRPPASTSATPLRLARATEGKH